MKLSNFTKNSDFASVSQVGDSFEIEVRGGGRVERGHEWTVKVATPKGAFFENVLIESSLLSGQIPASYVFQGVRSAGLGVNGGNYNKDWLSLFYIVRQTPEGYSFTVKAQCDLDGTTAPDFVARAKVRLSRAVF